MENKYNIAEKMKKKITKNMMNEKNLQKKKKMKMMKNKNKKIYNDNKKMK